MNKRAKLPSYSFILLIMRYGLLTFTLFLKDSSIDQANIIFTMSCLMVRQNEVCESIKVF